MANSTGEMPFLDHLEELRKRILLSLVAVLGGFGIGWWITTHFNLIQVVEAPIAPLIPGGKLAVMSATDPFMIVLKFAFILGLVLASPFVIYQLWLFLAPALTAREKRAIVPSLGIGFVLFGGGAALGWFYVVGPAVAWLLNFQSGTFNPLITYDSYMRLVVHLLVGMGISAELPLIMILLASLGIMSFRIYNKFRRYAVLASFVGGAILAPTPEVSMMILFTIPLLLLYEIGVAGAWLVERRRARAARIAAAAGMILLALCAAPRGMHAQVPQPPPAQGPPGRADTGRKAPLGQGLQRLDSSAMKRLGLPSTPKAFAPPDSIMQALLARRGFAATRFMADSVSFLVDSEQILLRGNASTLRDDDQLESHQISYNGLACLIRATGEPRFFQKGAQPMVGEPMSFTTCGDSSRAVIGAAFTALAERGANWFMRGNLAIDSSGKRLYGANTEFTSCDLPDPHYHFVAGKVKWVSQSVIVARPAVLYIRDVPVFWLPFIFQDTKRDRSSGILIPRFGFNDIVRTNRNYNRQVTNVGYYWAPNDYIDATGSMDWYANRYMQFSGTLNYKWLDRFVTGSLTLRKQIESSGNTNNVLQWNHDQRFNVTTSIHFNLNYQSASTVQLNNSLDPLASTRLITSQLNLTKNYSWGLISVGGTRSQALGTGAGDMSFPSLTISPKPFSLGRHFTFSPNFSLTNATRFSQPQTLPSVLSFGGVDSSGTSSTFSTRSTGMTLSLQSEILGFNWPNTLSYQDQTLTGRSVITTKIPNPAGGPDSISQTTIRGGNFLTSLDWKTTINLPLLLRGTWKVTPTVGVQNIDASAPLLVRSAASNGEWVSQGVKFLAGLSAAPTWFGFTKGGIGPYSRFRYTLAPALSLQWSPASSLSPTFARAQGLSVADVPAQTRAAVTFHQVFEGKLKPAATDTNTDPTHIASLPKKQLLSISTSAISYDFEQAKLPGHSGWQMGTLSNSFTSDLIPGLNVSMTHDLFQGQFTSDTARFSPFLTNVQAAVQITGRTFRPLARLLGLVHKDSVPVAPTPGLAPTTTSPLMLAPTASQFSPTGGMSAGLAPGGFNASLSYSFSRQRPFGQAALPACNDPGAIGTFGTASDPNCFGSLAPIQTPPSQSSLSINTSFSPTRYWSVSWTTTYDFTNGQFQQHQIHLQRDLHDWRAAFTFTKNVNGNFQLYFSMFLINLPEIKFDYNQTTLQQATGP